MSTEGGTRAIVAALAANIGIAVTKFVAFLLTGSSSMLAESVHSVADSGNQALLLLGGRRARKQATPLHPFGYGRERYFWAFVVSIVLFSVGGLFALYEAYHKFQHPEPIEGRWWWVPLRGPGGVHRAGELLVPHGDPRVEPRAGAPSWSEFVRRAKAPELPVVLLEDLAALIGLVFALFGVGLTLLTHNGIWDAVGTALIGILLVVVAITLSVEMKSLLLGEAGSVESVQAIETAIAGSEGVDRIIHMRTLHVGPEELLVAAKVAVTTTDTADEIADAINRAELAARQAVPSLTLLMYIEPDLDRGTTERPTWDRGTANAWPRPRAAAQRSFLEPRFRRRTVAWCVRWENWRMSEIGRDIGPAGTRSRTQASRLVPGLGRFVRLQGSSACGTRSRWASVMTSRTRIRFAVQDVDRLYGAPALARDAFLYSPALASVALGLLPWPVFYVLWTLLSAVTFVWLLKPLGRTWFVRRSSPRCPRSSREHLRPHGGRARAGSEQLAAVGLPRLTKIAGGSVRLVWLTLTRQWRALVDRDWSRPLLSSACPWRSAWTSGASGSSSCATGQQRRPIRLVLTLVVLCAPASRAVVVGALTRRAWLLSVATILVEPDVWTEHPDAARGYTSTGTVVGARRSPEQRHRADESFVRRRLRVDRSALLARCVRHTAPAVLRCHCNSRGIAASTASGP